MQEMYVHIQRLSSRRDAPFSPFGTVKCVQVSARFARGFTAHSIPSRCELPRFTSPVLKFLSRCLISFTTLWNYHGMCIQTTLLFPLCVSYAFVCRNHCRTLRYLGLQQCLPPLGRPSVSCDQQNNTKSSFRTSSTTNHKTVHNACRGRQRSDDEEYNNRKGFVVRVFQQG